MAVFGPFPAHSPLPLLVNALPHTQQRASSLYLIVIPRRSLYLPLARRMPRYPSTPYHDLPPTKTPTPHSILYCTRFPTVYIGYY